ncbi:uncharacterized protein [Acropora muricata]|uniref:uncharacterized protein isoform X2 n=1 Tax=Acropora muricata TaxID=159855 RepID=UPI0034E60D65
MSQDEVCQQASAVQISQGKILNITLLASEWKSTAGGLSTLNRELAIHLSQIQNVRVSLLVPEGACNDEDKMEARSFGISIRDAKKFIGLDSLFWLSNPPKNHKIDVIVGHGVKLGCQVQLIKIQAQFQNCKWVHVVHTASEDLSKYKGYSNPISKGEKKLWDEVDLCKEADLVVPVGPKLRKAYHRYLQSSKKDEDFFELIPGLFEREFEDLVAKQNPKDEKDDFIVLLCGRGDDEDFEVKGYNIAVKAFADQRLKGKRYSLLFVGSPEGEQDKVRKRLLNCGIDKKQLEVREFVKSRERMKDLFCEVDMVIMPSKSEGFGLVALEALSAGLPILVGSNSGFARAIEDIPFGSYSVVDSEDPSNWAERVVGVRDKHRVVLQENKVLKEHYRKEYCWKTQCEQLVDRLWRMVYGTSGAQAIAADDLFEQCPSAVSESVCQPNPKTKQQHIEIGAVTSGRGNEKTSRTSGDGLTMHELAGTSGAEAKAADDLFEQCPSAVSESVCQPDPTTKQQHIEIGAVTSGGGNEETSGDALTLLELADRFIKLKIEAKGLNEGQKKYVYDRLIVQATTFMETRNYSKVKVPGMSAFLEFLEALYNASLVALNLGSLVIILDCKTLRGLDKLWYDFLCGHLDKVAERYLVTDGIKKKLNLRTINLKTTIAEENYLKSKKVLMECSGEADSTTLSSQQGALDQGTASMTGMATAADDEELLFKQEDTDWMIRMKKARASRSTLHKASVVGQYEEVKRQLSSGCVADVKDQFLLTPLHLACWYGQESVVKLLLEYAADVNVTDKFQFTPLHKAERRNHHSIVKLLLDHKARPTLQQPPSLRTLGRRAFTRTDEHSGFNLLQAAVLEGDYDTVEKASVHLENFVEEMNCRTTGEKASIFPGKSAADILAAVKGRMESHPLIGEIYEEFVETEKTLTQLHSCAKSNHVEMAIELVLNYGMDVNVAAKRNITPLVWASPATSSLWIKTVIDLGADVNAQTFQESTFGYCSGTALRSAIHGNNANVVKVLLANKSDPIVDLQGNTVLHSSTSEGLFNISQLLIDSGCNVNGRNNSGETSLHSAVRGKNVAVAKLLLRNNADANIQDDKGNTPLHVSTREGLCDISQLLVGSGCEINVRNNSGETSLHSAVRGKNVAVVKLLLRNNADANVQGIKGNTPLHISTRRGLCDISQMLVDSGCKINVRNNSGETSLHCAVRGKNVAVVKLLLRNNADANVHDNYGNIPLHISSWIGLCNISQSLVDSGCKINVRNNGGETPLHSRVGDGNVAEVKFLLKNNADANIQDNQGNTPLHTSLRRGFSNISQLLIDSGCNKNLKNWEGKTPLDLKPFPYFRPYPGDSEEAKGSEGYAYASQKRFRHKRFFESEDKGDPLVSRRTLPSPPPPLLFSPRSGSLSKNRPEESSALRKRRVGGVKRKMKINPEAESSPVVGKGKEQSSK